MGKGRKKMLKRNKLLLEEIYKREYKRAETTTQKQALEKEINRIKKQAREDAKKSYEKGKTQKKKGYTKAKKKIKKISSRATDVSNQMMEDLLGW